MATILLVDDDEDLLMITSQLLQADGHTVTSAMDGKAGLASCKERRFDLIITDIVMPELNGLQLIEALRTAESRPRIIAVSGGSKLSRKVYLPLARNLGVERILAKPVQPEVLLQTITDVLAQPIQAPISRARP